MHGDHIGGNEAIAKAGRTRAGGNVVGDIGAAATATAAIIAHENVLNRLSAARRRAAAGAVCGVADRDVLRRKKREMLFNGEAVQIIPPAGRAHRRRQPRVLPQAHDVVATGDLFTTVMYPFIDEANGGTINGYINALNAILDITVPSNVNEGGTMVIPGHGRLSDEQDVIEYRDMATIVRDRIREYVQARHDARAGEGEEADARLRSALRHANRLLDDGAVRRGDLQADERRRTRRGRSPRVQKPRRRSRRKGAANERAPRQTDRYRLIAAAALALGFANALAIGVGSGTVGRVSAGWPAAGWSRRTWARHPDRCRRGGARRSI